MACGLRFPQSEHQIFPAIGILELQAEGQAWKKVGTNHHAESDFLELFLGVKGSVGDQAESVQESEEYTVKVARLLYSMRRGGSGQESVRRLVTRLRKMTLNSAVGVSVIDYQGTGGAPACMKLNAIGAQTCHAVMGAVQT
ncbi:hypothetical protein EDB85DRAFT_1892356 [Lactarius pseudohatsudake]|nr:hypothetical protein EDB85DRAFT_1892356 [Lactarius pseudohatsudake]